MLKLSVDVVTAAEAEKVRRSGLGVQVCIFGILTAGTGKPTGTMIYRGFPAYLHSNPASQPPSLLPYRGTALIKSADYRSVPSMPFSLPAPRWFYPLLAHCLCLYAASLESLMMNRLSTYR